MARGKAKSGDVGSIPWWLSGGDEECPHCGLLYAVEIEIRCTECDGPMCPHCKIRQAEFHYVCPACVADSGEGRTHG